MASFYTYLNYDTEKDFVVNLKDIFHWLGFARKDGIKKVLIKNFKQDIDYQIRQLAEIKSGKKEEVILMNVNTFKRLCSISGTKKATEIHEYFIKIEKILIGIINEENDELRLQLQTSQECLQVSHDSLLEKDKEKQIEKHNLLLSALSNKYVVYILKIFTYEDGDYVIKIGQTRNLKERILDHNYNYKSIGKPIVIDVFEVLRPDQFERFLLNETEINKHKTTKLTGFETSKEHILIDKQFTYQHVIDIIKKNIDKYQYASTELINQEHQLYLEKENIKIREKMLQLKNKELQNRNEAVKNVMDLFNISFQEAVNYIDRVPQIIPIEIPVVDENLPLNQESIDNVQSTKGIVIESKRGQRLQKIDVNTHDIIKTYDCINDALNSEDISRSRITNAHNTRQVYKNFRWHLVERDQDVNQKYNIGNNIIVNNQNTGYIAQLNTKKTIIKNVYKDQKTASKENGYNACSSISKSVKTGSITQNHIYQLYTDVSEDLRKEYERIHGKPFFMENGVEKICHQRNIRVCLYINKSDCIKKDKINNNTLNKYLKSGEPYNGFIYKYVNNKK